MEEIINELKCWFDEYDTDNIVVSDFDIHFQGTLVTNIYLEEDGNITIWSGDCEQDDYAEELVPNAEQKQFILCEILSCLI